MQHSPWQWRDGGILTLDPTWRYLCGIVLSLLIFTNLCIESLSDLSATFQVKLKASPASSEYQAICISNYTPSHLKPQNYVQGLMLAIMCSIDRPVTQWGAWPWVTPPGRPPPPHPSQLRPHSPRLSAPCFCSLFPVIIEAFQGCLNWIIYNWGAQTFIMRHNKPHGQTVTGRNRFNWIKIFMTWLSYRMPRKSHITLICSVGFYRL